MKNHTSSTRSPAICDYEGSTYRTDFWEGQGRDYENLVERIALQALLPPEGKCLLDIGAGFGRLADLYTGYENVILLDYSTSLLGEARQRRGDDGRTRYVAANFYHLPLVDGLVETTVMVRVLHHAQDPPAVLNEIARVVRPKGVLVLEYANKRHIKAILRYGLRRQGWSPFDLQPVEFAALNYDFHPAYVRHHLTQAGFDVQRERAVSVFRLPFLKRLIPSPILAILDGWFQRPLAPLKLTPSIFLRAQYQDGGDFHPADGFFCCPACHSPNLYESKEVTICQGCKRRWPIREGIYDFRWPPATDAA